ncbi:MAG: 4-hydroxy-3-methylbut-2-enyl diphosphate reductase [Candidatus Izemoplasmatales bacterium]|jgi:4-hydroxy-3-methylbut-2-enyl diphosphate reductase|nr:4-hydroxy-3-methylbut-2-enyl diphosphate reductase [Candidatus Izemoplasmatales bacterium]
MKVIAIRPRGFCPGVVNAIKIVEDVITNPKYPRPIQLLGMIVHNQYVVSDFAKKGVITIDEPSKSRLELAQLITTGTVIITAHGIQKSITKLLISKGVTVVDATCKDVYHTQTLIINKVAENYEIIYIGKKNHPETEGILGITDKIHVVENEKDIDKLSISSQKIFVTNQTTFSIKDISILVEIIQKAYPTAIISEEICDSTRIRQEAIIESNKNVDACFIVGDKRSNNTASLVKISIEETHTPTYLIESVLDIQKEMVLGKKIVSVSSGASTPNHITKQVITYLQNLKEDDV